MGMASSQARLLNITCRMHDNQREQGNLMLTKMALTRESQQITKKYQNALNTKVFKMSQNSGVTYTDISYSNLMRPGQANNNKPIILSNSAGRIIVNDDYKEYAEMISPNGTAGGDYETHRTEILAALTGISADDIENFSLTEKNAQEATDKANKAQEDLEKWKAKEKTAQKVDNKGIAKKIGKIGNYDFSNFGGTINVKSNDFTSVFDNIYNSLSKYFIDDEVLGIKNNTALKAACDAAVKNYNSLTENSGEKADESRKANGMEGSSGDWKIKVEDLISTVMGIYTNESGASYSKNSAGETVYTIRDSESLEWKNWKATLEEKQKAYDDALAERAKNIDANNQIFTGTQNSQIDFYDQLFTAIAENGWVYDNQIDDNNYLNNQLQNNQVFITEMEGNANYEEDSTDVNRRNKYDYSQTIASNYNPFYSVNDDFIKNKAFAEYEDAKLKVNQKEQRIDARLSKLDTEVKALEKIKEDLTKCISDNKERHMNLFS